MSSKWRGVLRRWACALALCLATPSLVSLGCGGQPESKTAVVKPGDMPAGGDWTGVYYNPVFGFLHLIKAGNSISGKWRTATGDKWGELNGMVTGDLLRYEWVEHTIGLVGPGAETRGKGYFRYVVPAGDNVDHELHGEWGLDKNEAGNPWMAIKQRNQNPDPDSIKPDETQQLKKSGDDWE